MKFLRFFLFLSIAGLTFSSCQKELSAEAGAAKGTLKAEATGDCLPILINGSYQKDTLLRTVSNYVEIQIDVTTTGSYRISTDTVNGYYFSTIGVAAATGLQTVRIYGAGRPINPGVDIFTVSFDGTSCEFNVVVTGTGGGGGGAATYTLGTTGTTCTGATLFGTYQQGLATSASNTATINVNVTNPGTYSISTGAVNGVTFSGSGTFTGTGANTIVLTASGTPATATTSTYPLTAGSSSCSFMVAYTAAGPAAAYTINCTGAVVSGTYTAGTATTSSNQITVNVTVTGGGSYSITSTTVNGISFSGSGVLPATPSAQTVVLTATGTPAAAGTFAYPLTGNSSTCSVNVTTSAPVATGFITATIGGVNKTFNVNIGGGVDNTSAPGFTISEVYGDAAATGSETIDIGVAVAGSNPPAVGVAYNVNATAYFAGVYYTSAAAVDYEAATGDTNPTPVMTITYSISTLNHAKGTFVGAIQDASNNVLQVTNGQFDVTF